jgi:hypothetical protein
MKAHNSKSNLQRGGVAPSPLITLSNRVIETHAQISTEIDRERERQRQRQIETDEEIIVISRVGSIYARLRSRIQLFDQEIKPLLLVLLEHGMSSSNYTIDAVLKEWLSLDKLVLTPDEFFWELFIQVESYQPDFDRIVSRVLPLLISNNSQDPIIGYMNEASTQINKFKDLLEDKVDATHGGEKRNHKKFKKSKKSKKSNRGTKSKKSTKKSTKKSRKDIKSKKFIKRSRKAYKKK